MPFFPQDLIVLYEVKGEVSELQGRKDEDQNRRFASTHRLPGLF